MRILLVGWPEPLGSELKQAIPGASFVSVDPFAAPAMKGAPWSLVLLNTNVVRGWELLDGWRVPLFLLVDRADEALALEAMEEKAQDYFFPDDLKRLIPSVRRELRQLEKVNRAECRKRRLNRILNVLWEANHALLTYTEERLFLERICHLIVEEGGYWLAWIGLAEHDEGKTVRPVAQCGFEASYLEEASVSWGDNERGRGPTGMAIRTGKSMVVRDIRTDPTFGPWREEAWKRGYAASLAIPLRIDEETIGTLSIYSPENDPFSEEEIALWEQVAADTAFGVRFLRTRDQKAQLQALKRADAMKDEFISLLSHELRTPINSITGFGSILEDEVVGPLNREQHRLLGKMLESTDSLLSLVNDLLDMSRIRAGRFSLFLHPVSFAEVVERVCENLAALAAQKGLLLRKELPDLPPMRIDAQRIGQVLTNLLSNAIKFTPKGGTVSLKAFLQGEELVCEVEDTGIGLSPEDLAKLFHPFGRVDEQATGTGLGLSISKSLVEAHGGRLAARSAGRGKGACFRFQLPLDRVGWELHEVAQGGRSSGH